MITYIKHQFNHGEAFSTIISVKVSSNSRGQRFNGQQLSKMTRKKCTGSAEIKRGGEGERGEGVMINVEIKL